jgi:hypothetical protein
LAVTSAQPQKGSKNGQSLPGKYQSELIQTKKGQNAIYTAGRGEAPPRGVRKVCENGKVPQAEAKRENTKKVRNINRMKHAIRDALGYYRQ